MLPEIISKEPLGPAVRHGDDQWGDIVRWTHYAMLNAEELGVTKANVDQMKNSDNPEIKRLLGTEGKFGEAIGLTNDWAYRIIKHVGNYGEIFERTSARARKLKIKRGQNALWTKGGLQYGIADPLIDHVMTGVRSDPGALSLFDANATLGGATFA